MKVIEITKKWAVVASHIIDVWLSGDDYKTLNITYDVPDRQKDSTTFDTRDDAEKAFSRIVAELRGIEALILED